MKLLNVDLYEENYDKIEHLIDRRDLIMASYMSKHSVMHRDDKGNPDEGIYYFTVCDRFDDFNSYNCKITIAGDDIKSIYCNCKDFSNKKSCKHLAAAFINHSNLMFDSSNYNEKLYSKFIKKYYAKDEKNKIKKELKLLINIVNNSYENSYISEVKITIGDKKMYSLQNHFSSFYDVFINEKGSAKFGKELEYNAQDYYFSKTNEKLIHAYKKYLDSCRYDTNSAFIEFMNYIELNNLKFTVNSHYIESIIEDSPLLSDIKKVNDEYIINFNYKELQPLCRYLRYIFFEGNVYDLSKKQAGLLEDIFDNELESIRVSKKEFKTFKNGLLKLIKNNLYVDDTASEDIKIDKLSDIELYFDISHDNISTKIILDYKNNKLNYFDKDDSIERDIEKENKVIEDLLNCNFIMENEKIYMSDIDNEVEFLENGIEKLSLYYKVFTSEELKKLKIRKKTSASSMFSIGQDNILSFDFNLDGIDSKELVNIFKDMRAKKKYYRLKNGDILNLNDENLNELSDLADEMNFTDEEIIKGNGKIQKYRAIYLDSIMKNKYNHVETNSLFKTFIENFYRSKDLKLTIDKEEMKTLRDYQVTGVKWLYNIHNTGFGGILADEMGLGKTIQSIYYIKQILLNEPNSKFLIVVPTSLVYNWQHEFELYAPNINICVLMGNKQNRISLVESNASVYITSYGTLREDEDLYKDKEFHTMFIDEAQTIKNFLASITKVVKEINAETKIALTGTPIENSVLELWSIFDYIMPGYLSNISKFKSKYKIRDFDDRENKLLDGLNRQISPFILRRKKENVIKDLPSKIENNIYIELSSEQKKLYVAELEKVKKEVEEIMERDGINKMAFLLLSLLTKLRQLCIDPKIIYDDYNGGSNKMDTLLYVLNDQLSNNNKVLVFTSFLSAIDIVSKKLEENNIDYYIIKGDVPSKERLRRVEEFNNRKTSAVFLIMLKSGGTGLNLTGASTVIHLDLWWNPQTENQATDRAHRIGQKKTVEVIKIITKGTIEEKIIDLQNKKKELSDKIVDGSIRDKDIVSSLTEKDIRNLLAYENKD